MSADHVLEELSAASQSDDGVMRLQAVIALGQTEDIGAVPPLLHALRDQDATVRLFAVRALRNICRIDAEVAQLLPDALLPLLNDPDPGVLRAAAFTLGDLSCNRAVEPLLKCFREADGALALDLLYALVEIGDSAVLKRLKKLASDKSAKVRQAVDRLTTQDLPENHPQPV